jgi:3-demethoxyubiquinol 3-hydroxylase
MQDRRLTPLDRLLAGAENALRTLAATGHPGARPSPSAGLADADLDDSQRSHAAGLMRVNHAGEIAAQGLYQGHAAVSRDAATEEQMQRAAREEYDHLAWCEQRLGELGSRPSLLSPLWYAGAFAIGAASGILGDKWSLGFVAETENQVCAHLTGHLGRLPEQDAKSRAIVEQMREEEERHGENALGAGAAELPPPVKRLMKLTAGIMTRTAYWI